MADTPHENRAGGASTPSSVPSQTPAFTLDNNTLQQIIANAISAHEAQKTPQPSSSNTNQPSKENMPASALSSRAKLPNPEPFKGDKKVYPIWKRKMEAKLWLDSHVIGADWISQTQFLLAFLSGEAAQYAEYFIRRQTGPYLAEELFKHLDLRYNDPHQKQRALAEHDRLKQGGKTFPEFVLELERLQSEAGVEEWGDDAKANILMGKISRELRELSVVSFASNPTSTYMERVDRLYALDNEYRAARLAGAYKSFAGEEPSRSTPQPVGNPQNVAQVYHQAPPQSEPMDWTRTNRVGNQYSWETDPRPEGPLVQKQEMDARRNAQACFTCGGKHRSRQCALKPNRNNRTLPRTQVKAADSVTQVYHATSSTLMEPQEQLKDLP
jgi:hypothetical protein